MTDPSENRERVDEFVLGLLDAAEEARFRAAMARDPALRAAVAESRDRFVELDLALAPQPAPESLWTRIAARLERAEPGDPEGIDGAPDAPLHVAAARWRRRSLTALAAALLLAVALGWSLVTRPEPQVIAILVNQQGEALALVEDFGPRTRVTPLVDISVPSGRTIEVWTKPSEEIGPVSLGVLGAPSRAVLRGPALPAPQERQLYEITFEQAGGSPTGRPTGPILAKGFATAPR